MQRNAHHISIRLAIFLLILLVPTALAQNAGDIVIISTDTSALPEVRMTLTAFDDAGVPIPLTASSLDILHQSERIPTENIRIIGEEQLGTFTIFLVDLPGGVEAELSTMDSAIKQFATPPYKGDNDWVALYRNGPQAAQQLLAPTNDANAIVGQLNSSPLQVQPGATALVDSLGSVLESVNSLRPEPNMSTSIVILSDGTDAVSTQFNAGALGARARELGVQLHTVVVDNVNLTFGVDIGRQYMESLATDSGGVSTSLDNAAGLATMWERASTSGSFTTVEYTVPQIVPGPAIVEVGLPNNPTISRVSTTLNIEANVPNVAFDLESLAHTLTLPNLENPVQLQLPTTISWLDGQERAIASAQVQVNGTPTEEVPVASIGDNFVATISTLAYGNNRVIVVVQDDQGLIAQTPELTLTVEEGRRAIPAEIRAGSNLRNVLLGIGTLFLVILALFSLWYLLTRGNLRERLASRGTRQPRRQPDAEPAARTPQLRPQPQPEAKAYEPVSGAQVEATELPPAPPVNVPAASAETLATIEILDSRTNLPRTVPVTRSEFLLGRSPTVDLAFTEDSTVSRIHATLVLDGQVFRIYDERSTSGTYLNDRQVPEYGLQISDGDEIHLGAVHLRFNRQS